MQSAVPHNAPEQVGACFGWSLIGAIESRVGLLTVDETAALLHKSSTSIYRMARRKQIPSLTIGGTRHFDPAALSQHFRKKSAYGLACPESTAWSFIRAIELHSGLFTVAELATVLRKSECTVYRLAQRKQIPSLIIGGTRYFEPAALGMHFRKKSPESAAAARMPMKIDPRC